jgi:predicted transcriptional regulator of viral defense system
MAMKELAPKRLDWTKILAQEARLSPVLLIKELAAKYALPAASVWKSLSRLAERGVVSRVTHGVYLNKLVRDSSPTDFIGILNPNSYVSLESALYHWGLSTQGPATLTCVATGKPREYRTSDFTISLRTITNRLFWGYIEIRSRYSNYKIAEPEKALLDWIYLALQSGVRPSLDELVLTSVDRDKIAKYLDKYPATVRNLLVNSLAFEHCVTQGTSEASQFSSARTSR